MQFHITKITSEKGKLPEKVRRKATGLRYPQLVNMAAEPPNKNVFPRQTVFAHFVRPSFQIKKGFF